MNRKLKFWILLAVIAVLSSACSTDNNSSSRQDQDTATKPPPQVRVESLPTFTPAPVLPTETGIAPTVAPAAPAGQDYGWQPPDIETQANGIEADINEIENGLKNQKFILKP